MQVSATSKLLIIQPIPFWVYGLKLVRWFTASKFASQQKAAHVAAFYGFILG